MAEVLTDSSRWTVSARSSGEVLAVRAGDDRLQVGFVGNPAGLQAGEIRDWLSELIGMATATSDRSGLVLATPLPIPRSLHQALTGLLFLQSEVWGSPAGAIPLSLAVVRCDDRVAFGWSGSGRVTLEGPGQASEPAWITVHDGGTVVVISGPRFSTKAESKWFSDAGWEVINMTQYPECFLARELEICYCNISLITDYDAGTAGADPVTNDDVVRVFAENNQKVRDLLYAMIPALPHERACVCATALAGAVF